MIFHTEENTFWYPTDRIDGIVIGNTRFRDKIDVTIHFKDDKRKDLYVSKFEAERLRNELQNQSGEIKL